MSSPPETPKPKLPESAPLRSPSPEERPPTSTTLQSLLSPRSSLANPPTSSEYATDATDANSDSGDSVVEVDLRFSTVPLSSASSTTIMAGSSRRSSSNSSSSIKAIKRASSRASNKSQDEHDDFVDANEGDETITRRLSKEGFQLLQVEFNKVHDNGPRSPGIGIDWDFWGVVMADYQGYAAANGDKLAHAIENGIPGQLRGMVWQLMAASKDPELEAEYLKLLRETKDSGPHDKAIMRDLGRTFPHHDFFQNGSGIGQENLYNVLRAYSLYDDQVGYCQGMPFVVAILLLNMPDEEAFCLLVRLMYSYDLRGHFLPEMPKLQLRLFQFDRLLEDQLPALHLHFLRQGVKSTMYCSQWFLTLFSYRFPLEIVFRIYDNILASGIEAIFAFSLLILQSNEQYMLNLKFEEILAYLNNGHLLGHYLLEGATPIDEAQANVPPSYNVSKFVQDAVALRITPFMLDSYAHEYEDMVRVRDAHQIEMDELRNSNRALSAQVKRLESNLAQLNTEHVEILNELVHSRLANESLEEELVKYKLLYAEAMHENEDAGSSHRMSTSRMSSRASLLSNRSMNSR